MNFGQFIYKQEPHLGKDIYALEKKKKKNIKDNRHKIVFNKTSLLVKYVAFIFWNMIDLNVPDTLLHIFSKNINVMSQLT